MAFGLFQKRVPEPAAPVREAKLAAAEAADHSDPHPQRIRTAQKP
jgi:hypothetical protein